MSLDPGRRRYVVLRINIDRFDHPSGLRCLRQMRLPQVIEASEVEPLRAEQDDLHREVTQMAHRVDATCGGILLSFVTSCVGSTIRESVFSTARAVRIVASASC
jgi:hypothetical protein